MEKRGGESGIEHGESFRYWSHGDLDVTAVDVTAVQAGPGQGRWHRRMRLNSVVETGQRI